MSSTVLNSVRVVVPVVMMRSVPEKASMTLRITTAPATQPFSGRTLSKKPITKTS
jgi:hypothetical protein